MLKKTLLSALVVLGFGSVAVAEEGANTIHDESFSFEGPFGKFDQQQLQRGLQVYTEICASCHGIQYLAYRNLADEGGPSLSVDQMKAYTAQFEVFDPELDDYRTAKPTDYFPLSTYDGAPDLSLMAKGRAAFHGPEGTGINQLIRGIGGPEYILAILTSYTGEEKEEAGSIFYENTAFPGGWIAMAPPLYGEDVEYADGHENSMEAESKDVAAFLMWVAEPKMMERKNAGMIAVLFLSFFAVLLYMTNKKIWSGVKHKQWGGKSAPSEQGDPIE